MNKILTIYFEQLLRLKWGVGGGGGGGGWGGGGGGGGGGESRGINDRVHRISCR